KIESCSRVGTIAQCRVTTQAPVGNDRRRIRLCVGIFRRNVGDATGFNGTTEAHIRHRVFRWLRRVYAQANMAPVLVPPGIRLLDPPERNMLTVSNINGRTLGQRLTISGVSSTDNAATLTLAVVNLNRVTDHVDRDVEFGTIEQRQIMRNFDSGDDRLDCYVVGRFQNVDLRGRSFTP